MTRLTTEALDALIAEHVERTCCGSPECVTPSWCRCGSSWPCTSPALILATEVRAAREEHRLTSEFLSGLSKADCLPMGVSDIQEMGYRLEQDIWVLAHYEGGRTE